MGSGETVLFFLGMDFLAPHNCWVREWYPFSPSRRTSTCCSHSLSHEQHMFFLAPAAPRFVEIDIGGSEMEGTSLSLSKLEQWPDKYKFELLIAG